MHQDKIETALSAALEYIEDSVRALSGSNDENALLDSLWLASAETEYAVFLLSLSQANSSENASWKHRSSSKQSIELKPALNSARELLRKAKVEIEAGNPEKSYREAWTARNLLLKAKELLEKKRKEEAKK